MKLRAFALLETIFRAMARFFDAQSDRFSLCSDCGRNRYKGAPCK